LLVYLVVRSTCVYVDAFNLYYGSVRGTPYRWLNLGELCQRLLPKNRIVRIKYFTALVAPRPNDPEQPIRQQTYIRALRTIPNLSVHYGHYLSSIVTRREVTASGGIGRAVRIHKSEEKGSDVNIATHLISDAYENQFEVAVLITNDSDLLEPVRLVKDRLRKPVGIINPQPHPSVVLRQACTFFKQIRQGVLRDSQFPTVLSDSIGTFHRPPAW